MAEGCLLYYITDRTAFAGDESRRRRMLLEKIGEAARAGVDYIQLREKDLPAHELESLAREAVRTIREAAKQATGNRQLETALLINSRTDVALAVEADGVHLRSDDGAPQDVREIWKRCGAGSVFDAADQRFPLLAQAARSGAPGTHNFQALLIGISCHSRSEVAQAATNGATFAVFAPMFEKKGSPTARLAGLAMLEQACKANIPVLALGGITLANARSCLNAGAAGIAAIRLFQEGNIVETVQKLRSL